MRQNFENYIVGLFCLFFLYYAAQAIFIRDIFRLFYVLIPALVLSLLPILLEYKFRIRFPSGTKILVALALLLHVAGGINRFYWMFAPYYDKLAHVVSACALMMVIFCFFLVLDREGKQYSRRAVILSIILITTVFMVSWEVLEYYIDVLVQSSYNNGMADTIGDLIANVIGMVIALILIRHHLKKIPAGKGIGWLLGGNEA